MIHTKVQTARPSGSEKEDFLIFSMYFNGLNLRSLVRGYLVSWDLHLNKIGKGPLGNATEFQASELSGTKEEDF